MYTWIYVCSKYAVAFGIVNKPLDYGAKFWKERPPAVWDGITVATEARPKSMLTTVFKCKLT